jgi:hypothetical protein
MLEVQTLSARRTVSLEELERLASDGIVEAGQVLPPDPDATHATFESVSGEYRASIPLGMARVQGRILLEEGALRLRVEEGDTLCWNVKDLERIRYTVGKEPDSVPENPPH